VRRHEGPLPGYPPGHGGKLDPVGKVILFLHLLDDLLGQLELMVHIARARQKNMQVVHDRSNLYENGISGTIQNPA